MARVPLSALIVLAAATVPPLIPAPASGGDSFDCSTSLGPSVLMQSFALSRHFMKPEPEEHNIFLHHHEDEEDPPSTVPPEPTDFSWSLGYTVTRTLTADSVIDGKTIPGDSELTHAFNGGMGWDPLRAWSFSTAVTLESVPTENYRNGLVELHFGYLFGLEHQEHHDAFRDVEDDPDIPYYKRISHRFVADPEAKRKEEGDITGPTLQTRFNIFYSKHLKSPTASVVRNVRGKVVLVQDQHVDGTAYGPEVTYAPTEARSFRLSFVRYFYDQLVENFLAAFNALPVISARSGLSGFATQLQSFPQLTLEGNYLFESKELWSWDLGLTYTSYELPTSPWSLAFAATYRHPLGKTWTYGLGGTLNLQSNANSILGVLSFSRPI